MKTLRIYLWTLAKTYGIDPLDLATIEQTEDGPVLVLESGIPSKTETAGAS